MRINENYNYNENLPYHRLNSLTPIWHARTVVKGLQHFDLLARLWGSWGGYVGERVVVIGLDGLVRVVVGVGMLVREWW